VTWSPSPAPALSLSPEEYEFQEAITGRVSETATLALVQAKVQVHPRLPRRVSANKLKKRGGVSPFE
jgi:hypothetical protein